jgi:DNA-binding NtrC family response regulator
VLVKIWWAKHSKDLSVVELKNVNDIQEKIKKECERIVQHDYKEKPEDFETAQAAVREICVEENKQQDENNKWSEEKINSLVDD